jgi:hypothetical protein
MAHSIEHKSQVHDEAVEYLITKLILDPALVGIEKVNTRAQLIDTFAEEYGYYTNSRGAFACENMWIIAAYDNCLAYLWHQKYSLNTTQVLGRLACLVLSKILGIGTAERNWKQFKAAKTGQRSRIATYKAKKQVLIYAKYQQARACAHTQKLSYAGKLWDDDDFESSKIDYFCKEIKESLHGNDVAVGAAAPIWILQLCRDKWEEKKIGTKGDQIFEAQIIAKYGGLKLLDIYKQ